MNRPVLIALIAAAVLGLLILVWPPLERDTVADGLLPEGQRPRLLNAAAPTLEASAAARMIAFAPPGAAPPAVADPTAAATPAAPAPPPVDLTPLLVGVSGTDAAPVGYFSSKGRTYRARRGETIDGWKVVSLSRRQARLAKGRRHLTTALFAGRSGALSPPMAVTAPTPGSTPAAATAAGPPSTTAAPPPGLRKRKPLPPLPPGSKGYWSGPKGEKPPPGFTPMPDLRE
ncbi:hypothetical protein QO010_003531 [Caulobacter ginsengisoli]|uniref:Type II secretion system protein GspC N-terminal domain-containing protein n=1 Tax=Caulobacter ginsengisoli TaxID=400775 RepID=A0ABU0IUR7_9CAUL|nr:hypothetical protein [Caulobacter ginsengisoli]MDQ0465739.1 hypothetical protein [Caulobacter ginsengisoli]